MSADDPIYFDHNATTPLDPRVLEAMLPWLRDRHGNPSSAHFVGRRARRAVEQAREKVAALVGARPAEIVFSSSGSEANNTVIYAAAGRPPEGGPTDTYPGGHLVTSALEHPSVRMAAARVQAQGRMDVTELAPGADGRVGPRGVAQALRGDTRLVCLMLANNELGTLQPVAEIAALCRRRGVPVLCDASQAVGKVPVDVKELGVDYLVLAGHKFHAPPGVAALWVRTGADLEPLLVGGSQEIGRRAGTENVPGIVGLGEASALAHAELDRRHADLSALRERFERGLEAIPGAVVHCAETERLPHTSHVAFVVPPEAGSSNSSTAPISGHELLLRLDRAGFAVSTGSACHAGTPQPSAALVAMGVTEGEALASLRISFGITNTADEVDRFLEVLALEVEALRAPAVAV